MERFAWFALRPHPAIHNFIYGLSAVWVVMGVTTIPGDALNGWVILLASIVMAAYNYHSARVIKRKFSTLAAVSENPDKYIGLVREIKAEIDRLIPDDTGTVGLHKRLVGHEKYEWLLVHRQGRLRTCILTESEEVQRLDTFGASPLVIGHGRCFYKSSPLCVGYVDFVNLDHGSEQLPEIVEPDGELSIEDQMKLSLVAIDDLEELRTLLFNDDEWNEIELPRPS